MLPSESIQPQLNESLLEFSVVFDSQIADYYVYNNAKELQRLDDQYVVLDPAYRLITCSHTAIILPVPLFEKKDDQTNIIDNSYDRAMKGI